MGSMFDGIQLPAAFDAHVHLRDGAMMEAVVPTIRDGGVDTVYVMPNLVPPLTTVAMALDYQRQLEALEPNVKFLMSLYLHPSIDAAVIVEAKKAGIRGVKVYPAGVTTHSSSGVTDLRAFYPVFQEMQNQELVLNLHGECPSGGSISVLNAEERFLPTLIDLHRDFPKLRIILEHCSTEAALRAVNSCSETVAGTITAHHLSLIVDDWAGDSFNYCKPVAKRPEDRAALLEAAVSGNPKFFLGSDSAPHATHDKQKGPHAKDSPGVFTAPYVVPLVLDALEAGRRHGLRREQLTHRNIAGFLSGFGRAFYNIDQDTPMGNSTIVIGTRDAVQIPDTITDRRKTIAVVPFRSGQYTRSVKWI